MRYARLIATASLAAFALGCSGNRLALQGQLQQLQQQQLAISRQNEELRRRATALDQDNQRLQSMLAQSQQREKLLEDQIAVLKQQLESVTTQLAKVEQEKQQIEEESRTLAASLQRRIGAAIEPNNSLLASLPSFADPDIHVRRDGDVIRVELPADRLFQPGTANLTEEGKQLLLEVANRLAREFPRQIIGIEGHLDNQPLAWPQWRNHMHLSTAWAIATYELLIHDSPLRPEQLFVVGHGKNHPVVSNATPAGQRRNRRIELVVYPESME